jgi:hypothetical protein
MRSLHLVSLALPLALVGAPAAAQSLTTVTTMPVTGSVPQVCAMQQGSIQSGSLVNVAGLDGDTLRIIQFVDPTTLSVKAASATISFDAVCNFPHAVRVESSNNGLWPVDGRITQVPGGFAYAVPYTAQVTWGIANAQFSADAKTRRIAQQTINVDAPAAGQLNLRIEIAEGASNVENRAPVIAGTYVDTVRIFLEPR